MQEHEILLEMKGISKRFPGVQALQDVDLTLHKGEVLALVGENGAGKSTLMNILLGSIRADAGEIVLQGEPFQPKSPSEALKNGISMIHQELMLVPSMTVEENIWLGRERRFIKFGYLNTKKREQETRRLLEKLGLDLVQKESIANLNVASMQLTELARAVSYASKVIIMDEPTSAFTDREIQTLFRIVRSLKEEGVGIIFITHKLGEVFAIADTVTVLRDGCRINTLPVGDVDENRLVTMMVGREVSDLYPKETVPIGETVLEVKDLSRKGYFEHVSFSLKKGEVLGFCGLIGAGRSEIMECIFGLERPDEGKILLHGKPYQARKARDAVNKGLAMVTEDRLRRGLIHMLSVAFNMGLAYLDKATKYGFVNDKKIRENCQRIREQIGIKVDTIDQEAGTLSGGNQQKVIIGKWLMQEPEIFILDEPTRGIDVGAKAEIYKLIGKMAKEGKAVILVSSELPELMGLSDRIIVMSNGKMAATLARAEFHEETLIKHAFSAQK